MTDSKLATKGKLRQACLRFLIPTARFLMRGGFTANEFIELAKLAFVEAAAIEHGARGREANFSTIAAVTGLSRRSVSRLRSVTVDFSNDSVSVLSPIGDLLQKWHTDPRFVDDVGCPVPLELDGPSPSFRELLSDIVSDFPVVAMRAELIRSGAARELADGRLLPLSRQAVPEVAEEKLLASLSFNLRALVTTIAHNSDPNRNGPGRIERFVNGPRLNAVGRESARLRVRQLVSEYAVFLDDELTRIAEAQGANTVNGKRVGVGLFYFEE